MRATEIEPGDVLTDPDTGRTVYTVLDTRPLDGEIVVGVRYEVDGGTGLRYFARDQDVPLTRPEPPSQVDYDAAGLSGLGPGEPSTYEQRRAARIALRRAEDRAAEAKDTLHGLRSRGAAAHVTAAAEIAYRDACRAEDDAALVVDRLNASQVSGLTPGGSCRS